MKQNDPVRRCTTVGFLLLAFSLPLGLTFEALHAMKVQVYLGSAMRREMWTLAHAHGAMLGILLPVFAALAPCWIASDATRGVSRLLVPGALLMPLGFLLGGVLNSEGDPSVGVLLVPIGGILVLVALVRAALVARAE